MTVLWKAAWKNAIWQKKVLKEAGNEFGEKFRKKQSFATRDFYRVWNCGMCEHSFLYAVMRCPECESTDIEQRTYPTLHSLVA